MDFYTLLDHVIDLLRQRQRVTYRALQRQFQLDDAALQDLKDELLYAHPQVRDDEGRGLLWTGDADSTAPPPATPVQTHEHIPLAYTPTHLAEKILTSRSALEGERKQVTVLFADLKGSTELIRDLDPEAAQHLLDPALQCMMDAVHRFEGTVNQVLGDGIMALFGAPLAHEDHAVRACYAALAMQAAILTYAEEARRAHGVAMQMRVGLNSGEVVVRAIGNDLHMDYSAIGQTTHLAARMEQLATPGSILLTADTLRLVEGLVQVKAVGPIPVKGLPEPIKVFELVGASTLRGRFQARAVGGLTRFVGRETELVALGSAQERAWTAHGQVVAIVGEAGVGKSRLVYEFVHSHRTRDWLVLESASVSYGKATPYCPVIDLLRRYAHVEEHDNTRTIRAKVTGQVLTLDDTLQDAIPPLLSLLDALPEESPFLRLDPPQRRQRTLDALNRVLLRESQGQPLLLVFEDLHWIDAETQALLDSLVESLPTVRLLLLVNYRPEYQHGWGRKTYYTQLRLDPLPPVSADKLLQALLGDDPSLAPLTQLLIARTEGNPFFLEESVQALVETGVLAGERGAYRLGQPLQELHVPATVQAVLASRIDRLAAQDKRLLQTAAVIGTDVSWSLVQVLAELPDEALHRGLARLQAAEFLYETRLFPEQEYTFKHALSHEVAYRSLLQERRRVLHGRIVEALETLAGDRLDDQVERLAQHALRGEAWGKAVTYLRQAGAKAFARSANREALTSFEQALTALTHLLETRETREQGIDVRCELRNALFPMAEFGRIEEYLQEAEALARSLDDQRRLGWVSAYLSGHHMATGGDATEMRTCAQRVKTISDTLSDGPLQAAAQYYLFLACHIAGDYYATEQACQRLMQLLGDDRTPERFGLAVFPAVSARAYLARTLAERGVFDDGDAHGHEAIRIAEALDHPYSIIFACLGLAYLKSLRGDLSSATHLLERAVAQSQEWNITYLTPIALASLGYVYAWSGRTREGITWLEQALATYESAGIGWFHSISVVQLGETYLLADQAEAARACADRAVRLARERGERGYEAYALRLLGDVARHRNPPDTEQAETSYQQALALTEELGMRPLQAHCHHGLGTLYAKIDRREQARTELSTAIEMYTSMAMTFWLPQTEAALAQVEGR
jgi:class 3 adenylate cyclase/tetratricopeptide (TPR) repeat protein